MRWFSTFADWASKATGRPIAFLLAALSCLIWAASGPVFNYSDTWMMWINTGTTIVTFLMIFLLQHSQNRDGAAIQTKLDVLIKASPAPNVFVGIDKATTEEIETMRQREIEG